MIEKSGTGLSWSSQRLVNMTDEPKEEFENSHDALRRTYRNTLPERAEHLRSRWRTLDTAGFEPAMVQALAKFVHQLSGSAGYYGYSEISRRAAVLERILTRALADGGEDWSESSIRAGAEVEHLCNALTTPEEHQDRPGP